MWPTARRDMASRRQIVDGNDPFAVYEATRRAVEHARAGNGPYLIECKTFRMTGHSAHDPADYVPKGMFEEWGALCPIQRMQDRMVEEGWASREEVDAILSRIRKETDEAIEWAEKSPYPDPSELTDRVYE
jgi:TPP-dependent pyruvate/acetoin dehydrogenase alpha subunit